MANHVNLLDPPWIYSVVTRPVHFVATEELFRKTILGAALRMVGVFPIRKASQDFQSVKNIITLLRAGVLIGIYPEGSRSWDGTNSPIIPTIARIIRRMKVPVYSCRVDGGYLNFPRWAAKMRPIPVRLVFNKLYDRDTLPDSDEKIIEEIAAAIRIQDYARVNRAAVREMHRQVGDLVLDEHGVARRGLLVRHLVLPGDRSNTDAVLSFLAREISKQTYVNLMDQYHPAYHAAEHPPLDRPLRAEEYRAVLESARRRGLVRLDGRPSRFGETLPVRP